MRSCAAYLITAHRYEYFLYIKVMPVAADRGNVHSIMHTQKNHTRSRQRQSN